MPSPLSHSAVAYAIYRLSRSKTLLAHLGSHASDHRLLVAWVVASLLPDLDAVPGLLTGDISSYHNNLTHSPFAGVVVSFVVAGLVWLWRREGAWQWFVLVLLGFQLHVFMDFLTAGRGVMMLWPLTTQRFEAPVNLFYGLHYSEGLWSTRHLITLSTELGFVLLLALVISVVLRRRNSTPVSDMEPDDVVG